jgi:Flp pilus assembly protein TadB
VQLEAGPVLWSVTGAFVGLLLAQGDLFVSGPSRSVGVLALLGGAGGWLAWSARRSTLRERTARSLRYELPVICDALALQVVSGESVASALSHVVHTTKGIAREELSTALRASEAVGVEEGLMRAGASSAHSDGRRLYELLAHAHLSGGRLADALMDLAADYRASLERDLTTESGRRSVTTYGPVLALMVPTALLFLLYPTLIGLRSLAGAP